MVFVDADKLAYECDWGFKAGGPLDTFKMCFSTFPGGMPLNTFTMGRVWLGSLTKSPFVLDGAVGGVGGGAVRSGDGEDKGDVRDGAGGHGGRDGCAGGDRRGD